MGSGGAPAAAGSRGGARGVPAGAAAQFWVEMGGKRLFGGSRAASLVVGLWSEALAAALAPRNSSQGHGGGEAGGRLREGRRRPQHAIYGSGGKNAAGLRAEQRAGGARPGSACFPFSPLLQRVTRAFPLPVVLPSCKVDAAGKARSGHAAGTKSALLPSCHMSWLPAPLGS